MKCGRCVQQQQRQSIGFTTLCSIYSIIACSIHTTQKIHTELEQQLLCRYLWVDERISSYQRQFTLISFSVVVFDTFASRTMCTAVNPSDQRGVGVKNKKIGDMGKTTIFFSLHMLLNFPISQFSTPFHRFLPAAGGHEQHRQKAQQEA